MTSVPDCFEVVRVQKVGLRRLKLNERGIELRGQRGRLRLGVGKCGKWWSHRD